MVSKHEPIHATPEEQVQGRALYLALRHTINLADIVGIAPNVIMSSMVQATIRAQMDLGAVEPEEMLIQSIKMAFKMRAKDVRTEGNA